MRRIILFILLSLTAQITVAIEHVTLQLGTVAGNGWQLNQVDLQIQPISHQKIKLQVKVAALVLSSLKTPLEQLQLICQEGSYIGQKITCSNGYLKIAQGLLDKSEVAVNFSYDLQQQQLIFHIKQLSLAQGHITLKADFSAKNRQATLEIQQIHLAPFLEKLSTFISLPELPSLQGLLTATFQLNDNAVHITGKLTEFNFSNNEGNRAGENLITEFTVSARQQQAEWQIENSLTIQQGEIYVDPIYVNVIKDHSLELTTKMTWKTHQLIVESFSYHHRQVIYFKGNSLFQLIPTFKVTKLLIQLRPTELQKFYTHYLKSWLSSGTFGALDLTGTLAGKLDWQQDQISVETKLEQVTIEDTKKRFGLKECYGTIHWHNHATRSNSELRWSGAYFASKVQLGASYLTARFNGRQFELLQPWRQPFLDGMVQVEKLQIRQIGQEDTQFDFIGKITPISISTISNALNLPVLTGHLSGQFPAIRYHQRQLEIEGELLVQLFEGKITVHSLRVENPFTQPALLATINVDKINLKTLTNVTEFGQIQGHLSGWIHELHLVHWQPVSFDAYFMTPKDNTLPLKISQKAVNNLSNIGGGGIVNAISRGILSLFEEFPYQAIGIGCHLRQGICELKGLEPVKGGYYIVKGTGLPRIDIIGYNQKINWKDLLTRLKSAAGASHPVVK